MAGIQFKKSGNSAYPVFLQAGGYTLPVEAGVIEELKGHLSESPDAFLDLIIQKVANNTYLQDLIQKEIKSAGDPPTQIASLQDFVRGYQGKKRWRWSIFG